MNIVSFSGGKDSTAMLLLMIEKNYPIDIILFCDTGLEFPDLLNHISEVESYINKDVTIIKPDKSFEYYFFKYKRKSKSSKYPNKYGLGFPGFKFRWCTGQLKTTPIKSYLNKLGKPYNEFIGFTYNEIYRTKRTSSKHYNVHYPLIDLKITSNMALQYCYSKGFTWNGLYEKFTHLGCWCCPLQSINDLKNLYIHFPELWAKLLCYQSFSSKINRQFRTDISLYDLENRFIKEIHNDSLQLKINI